MRCGHENIIELKNESVRKSTPRLRKLLPLDFFQTKADKAKHTLFFFRLWLDKIIEAIRIDKEWFFLTGDVRFVS